MKRIDELRAGLIAFLAHSSRSTFPTVANRVGSEPFKQGTVLPLLTVVRLPGEGYHRMGTRAFPLDVDFMISAWSKSVYEAEKLISQVLDDLDGHVGLLGSVTVEMSKMLTINPEIYDANAQLFRASADFRFSYDPEA